MKVKNHDSKNFFKIFLEYIESSDQFIYNNISTFYHFVQEAFSKVPLTVSEITKEVCFFSNESILNDQNLNESWDIHEEKILYWKVGIVYNKLLNWNHFYYKEPELQYTINKFLKNKKEEA